MPIPRNRFTAAGAQRYLGGFCARYCDFQNGTSNNQKEEEQQQQQRLLPEHPERYLDDAAAFARDYLDFTPDDRQTELLVAPVLHHKRLIINWGRQCGKSTILAVLILYFALIRKAGSLILIVGGRGVHTSELIHKIDQFIDALGWSKCPGIAGRQIARRLPNGSRIVTASTPSVGRCNSADLLVFDEAAVIRDSVWMTAFPTIAATSGSMIVASTPGGTSGLFYDIWNNTENRFPEWFRSRRTAAETPRIPKQVIEEARRLKGSAYADTEFLCEFRDNGQALLKRADLERLFGMKPAGAGSEAK